MVSSLFSDILFIMRRYLRYLSSMENLAGCGDFTGPPHFGQLSSLRVYEPQRSHRLRSQTIVASTPA